MPPPPLPAPVQGIKRTSSGGRKSTLHSLFLFPTDAWDRKIPECLSGALILSIDLQVGDVANIRQGEQSPYPEEATHFRHP